MQLQSGVSRSVARAELGLRRESFSQTDSISSCPARHAGHATGVASMAEPFLGEIRLMPFGFAPRGWASANGQVLPIAQNQALFSLCGTTYGGNGVTTFALPDLRGRAPMHLSSTYPQGATVGEQAHTLLITEMPTHTHIVSTSSKTADLVAPNNGIQFASYVAADGTGQYFYEGASGLQAMNANNVGSAGGGQAHQNMQPYLVINFCIALQGIFPSRN